MNSRELKRRIVSVQDTVKITRAMQMISASKLYKSRQKSDSARKYLESLHHILKEADDVELSDSPMLHGNGSDGVGLIVIAGDKGLCGDTNHRVLELADRLIAEKNVTKIFAIGQEAREYYRRKKMSLNNYYAHMSNEPHSFDAITVANDMLAHFEKKEYGEIYLVYTSTPSYTKIVPAVKRILPIDMPPSSGTEDIFEPHTKEAVKNFLSQYVMAEIYSALADSNLAINYKRMLAMQEATKNGEEIVSDVTQEYNHQRQESITAELVTSSASVTMGNQS